MDEGLMLIIYIAASIGSLVLWWFIGSINERRHIKSLEQREQSSLGRMNVTTLKRPSGEVSLSKPPEIVFGAAVIASDGFKTWVFALKNIFGGRSVSFMRLFDRARREATLRMLASAQERGFDAVCNVRYESSDIGGNAGEGKKAKPMPMAVCLVSGTAYRMA